jgi:hypothetical protein
MYPLLLRIKLGNINRLRLTEQISSLGEVIVQESVLFTGLIPDSRIFEFMETGNLFIEFFESVSANEATAVTDNTPAIRAASDCAGKFHYLLTERYERIYMRNPLSLNQISAAMHDIIDAVKTRRQIPWNLC